MKLSDQGEAAATMPLRKSLKRNYMTRAGFTAVTTLSITTDYVGKLTPVPVHPIE